MNKYRTHNLSELTEKEIDREVILSGWLHRKRDHGNLLFADLRDHYGITQCVIEKNNNGEIQFEEINEKMDALKIQEKRSFRNNRKYSEEFSAFYERLKGI